MRALLVTAGLLVLAGTAAAGQPTGRTLRKSASGPIEALATDNGEIAWFTANDLGDGCAQVHVFSPGKRDRIAPKPPSSSMTCRWDLTGAASQLAVASRTSTVLWTLHGTGTSSFDQVLAAQIGGPERSIQRLSRASDGTGEWVADVTGAGKTLAYSWDDVEYVDKLACLSGGSCKEKIANGGIQLVTRTGPPTPLPGAVPALQLAAAAGRIAYVPATMVKSNRPATSTDNTLDIVDATTGEVLGQPFVAGIPVAIALSSHVFAVLTTQAGPRDRITWFSATDGTKLGSVLVSPLTAPQLTASGKLIVYRSGRLLRGISTANGHIRTLAKTGLGIVDFSLTRGRLVWTENYGNNGRVHGETGRLRALALG